MSKQFIDYIQDFKKAIKKSPKKIDEIVSNYVAHDTEFDGLESIKEKIKKLKELK